MTPCSAAEWERIFARGQDLGGLRFLDHRDELVTADSMFAWVPDLPATDDSDLWHPLDTLVAPLVSPSSKDLLGALSVDVPDDGRRPASDQLDLLRMFAGHAALAIERAHLYGELEASRDRLRHTALHDPLTGLANRAQLEASADALGSGPHRQVGVLVVDLDGFKAVNDTAGHLAGDELLSVVAKRMQGCVRAGDLLTRLGGDEFAIVVSGDEIGDLISGLTGRLRDAVRRPITVRGGTSHTVSASIGSAVTPTPVDLFSVLATADAAMYRDKRGHC